MQLTRIHLHSDNSGEPEPTGSIQYVIISGIVDFFLILIATLNYINLATALTVSFQSYKAATANPADSIWTE